LFVGSYKIFLKFILELETEGEKVDCSGIGKFSQEQELGCSRSLDKDYHGRCTYRGRAFENNSGRIPCLIGG
jgi:hypothetical protein